MLTEQRFRLIGGQVSQHHQDRGFAVSAAGGKRSAGGRVITVRGLHDDVDLALHQFLVGRFHINHQVAVDFPLRIIEPVVSMLSTSFCAVPAFIREEPVTTSGPTTGVSAIAATCDMRCRDYR